MGALTCCSIDNIWSALPPPILCCPLVCATLWISRDVHYDSQVLFVMHVIADGSMSILDMYRGVYM
jgi:hypothetical protein